MPKGLIAIQGTSQEMLAPWAPDDAALLLIANRHLVRHAADSLYRAGAHEVLVVAEAGTAAMAREAFGEDARGVEFIGLDRPPSAAEAVLVARDRLAGHRFLVHTADGLLVREHGVLARAIADEGTDAALFFHPDGRPQREPLPAGVHVFGPRLLDVLEPGLRLSDAIERLADAGGHVRAGVLEHWWRHRGSAEDLLEVNRRVLDEMAPEPVATQDLVGTRLEGRVHVHPTAHLRDAVVRGPAIIGAHARVTDSYVGPYSSIGDGAEIENAEIACSIVLPRARIRHVGVRVEDSIVGPGASVGRDFALPKAMRLLVGGGAQITLA